MQRTQISAARLLSMQSLFGSLDAKAIDRIAQATSVVEAERGRMIFRRGERCTGLHVLVYGQVKLALEARQGEERVIELLEPGASFGAPAMFLGKPYMLTAEALADSKLLHIARDAMLAQIDRDPQFAARIIASLSARLVQLVAAVETCTLLTGMQRVSSYLLTGLTNGNGSAGAEATILFPTRKGIIASQLNLTQEHFSRILHELAVAGTIEVRGRAVRVLDLKRLRASAS